MTPEEKAKELINKFYQPLGYIKHNENSNNLWEHGKKLALICVDEIIKDYKNSMEAVPEFPHVYVGGLLHWQEVKQEIEKL